MHLLTPRKGWENEHLAAYLLSRISFVAQPSTVADDLGSDFFCTLFQVVVENERECLAPRSSFAIQVKSSPEVIPVDKKIDYFLQLELPFFVGVATQSPPELRIYSAEFLPVLTSVEGRPNRLRLRPVDSASWSLEGFYEKGPDRSLTLLCPLVVTLSTTDDRPARNVATETLLAICKRALTNLAARRTEEHIYDLDSKSHFKIVAGSGSFHHFRQNFVKRLGEVFYNLLWIYEKRPASFCREEFLAFESLYNAIREHYAPWPGYVTEPYKTLKAKMGQAK